METRTNISLHCSIPYNRRIKQINDHLLCFPSSRINFLPNSQRQRKIFFLHVDSGFLVANRSRTVSLMSHRYASPDTHLMTHERLVNKRLVNRLPNLKRRLSKQNKRFPITLSILVTRFCPES